MRKIQFVLRCLPRAALLLSLYAIILFRWGGNPAIWEYDGWNAFAVTFSILPSPLQEQFLTENKSKLDAKIWYGLSSDYAPRSRISRISQIAGRLIHKKKLQSKLHKYNKD